MSRSFLEYFGRHLYQSASLIGTLAGTIAGFVYARDYIWIPLTFLVIFVAAALFTCHQLYQDAKMARHEAESERLRRLDLEGRVEQEKQQVLVEAERRVRAETDVRVQSLVAEALERYEGLSAERASAAVLRELAARLSFVKRMRLLTQSATRPIEVRKIEFFAGKLFVSVRVDAAATKHLRVGDPFLLHEELSSRTRVTAALLRVNQPPDMVRRSAHFVVEEIYGEMSATLDRLALTDDLEALRRLRIAPVVDVARYRNLHIDDAMQLIDLLAAEPRTASF